MCPALMILMTMFVAPRILDNVGLGAAGMPCLFEKQTGPVVLPKRRKAMTNPTDPDTEKNEMRVMWIGSAAIVLLILAAMGINMLIAHNTGAGSVEKGSQSATVPPK
jgi:hypothetical protein